MSKTIRKVADFLKLLLSTTKEQARALFYTLTPIQTLAICEIAFNIQKLPVTRKVLKELQKRKYLFKKLGDKTLGVQKKIILIQTHYRQVRATLQLIKAEILSLLE
jgi:hypothetical protein